MRKPGRSMPEFFRSADLRAVWLVRSRKLLSQLEFWLGLIGYDRQTRSFSSWIYLIYVFIFFSVWIFVVLVLLADFAGQALNALPFGSPLSAAVAVGGVAFIAAFLLELYSASRRSPFVFSEADATLLCLTPVDRRWVALAWFLGEWAARAPFLWAGAVVLGYACLEAQFPGELSAAGLPVYLLAGIRMLAIALPLHLAAQSLAWSVGAWRLGWKRDWPALRWMAPFLAILIVAAWTLSSLRSEVVFPAWAWGAAFPIRAGLGAAPLPSGIGLGLLWAAVGLSLLWAAARGMSLARAAQETREQEALQTALLFGATDLARELRQRQRLGAGKKPGRLPVRPGPAALVWKNAVQGLRSFSVDQFLPWLGILGLSLAIFQVPDWGARAWLSLLWILFVGGRSVSPLRRDLGRWWLLHQFPYSSEQLVFLDLGMPLVGVALTGGVALGLASWVGVAIPPLAGWLFFPGAVGAALAAVVDVLRQCRAGRLLAGSAPDRSLLSVLLGALALGIPGCVAWLLLAVLSLPAWLGISAMLAVCAGLDYGLYRWAGSLLRNVR